MVEGAMERVVTLNTSGEILLTDFGQQSAEPHLVSLLEQLRKFIPQTAEAQSLLGAALDLARKKK